MLVVGATRILRPALDELCASGTIVYALARGADSLGDVPGVCPMPIDLGDALGVSRKLQAFPRFDSALVYAPTAAAHVPDLIADHTDGRVVELFTSTWAEYVPDTAEHGDERPDLGALPSVGVPLLLGWADDGHGGTRWHTPAEISRAALDVLAGGVPAVLGTVRPRSARPGG